MKTIKMPPMTFYAFALLCALPAFGLAQARDLKEIEKPPLPAFTPQQPQRVELANGMLLLLQPDRELPLIRGNAMIRGGSRDEAAEKIGLVDIYGQAWRTGGTAKRSGDDLDDFLEMRAAKVETDGGQDSTSISFNCLTENFDEVFAVFEELLRSEPAFPDDKIELAKRQMKTEIARRNDNHWEIASREALKLVYGADSPYARVPELATVDAVGRDDLVSWFHAHVHPNNIILSISGDFEPQNMTARIEKAFGDWPQGPAMVRSEIAIPAQKTGVYLINKEDVKQCNVRLVHLGTTRDNPDYYAIEVMNEVFGGGFSARLFTNVRSKKGLAYSVGGGVGTSYDHPGVFQISLGTKNEGMAAGIDALFEEIDGMLTRTVTAEEMARAKDSLLNSFIFRVDSKDKVLRQQATYAFYGYPADFLERYRAGIEKVTLDDVTRVAREYIHKDQMAILIVGKVADFDRPAATFGPVKEIDITIPGM